MSKRLLTQIGFLLLAQTWMLLRVLFQAAWGCLLWLFLAERQRCTSVFACLVLGLEIRLWSPTLTFVASANPVLYLGGTPAFIDSDLDTWNLDPELLREYLESSAKHGDLPKAVVVVHLFGQSADMDPILAVCRHYGVPVLEDAAEALGSTYKGRRLGTLGDIGIFSLNGNKIITATGGRSAYFSQRRMG